MTDSRAPNAIVSHPVCGAIQSESTGQETLVFETVALFDTPSGPMVAFSGTVGTQPRDIRLVLCLEQLTSTVCQLIDREKSGDQT